MQTTSIFFEQEFFPWGGLPYPCEHAKEALKHIQEGNASMANEMLAFQQATVDHRGKPIYSLFQQESGCRFHELEEANDALFKALEVELSPSYSFVESELGLVYHRKPEQALVCLATGCKSGMGAFLVRNGGVVNFGPQLFPLGDCRSFGLAGRGRSVEAAHNTLRYQCRLAAPHDRNTGIPWLGDSGFSGGWIESICAIEPDRLQIACEIEGFRPLCDFLFTFFVKADACFVAGSHKLIPRSLDRYQGPAQTIELDGLTLSPLEGFEAMEVMPLAGDTSYWGADFMVSLAPLNKSFNFSITRS